MDLSFCIVTENPLCCKSLAKDAAIIPFPKDEVTPPVTKYVFGVVHAVFLGLSKSTNI